MVVIILVDKWMLSSVLFSYVGRNYYTHTGMTQKSYLSLGAISF